MPQLINEISTHSNVAHNNKSLLNLSYACIMHWFFLHAKSEWKGRWFFLLYIYLTRKKTAHTQNFTAYTRMLCIDCRKLQMMMYQAGWHLYICTYIAYKVIKVGIKYRFFSLIIIWSYIISLRLFWLLLNIF